MTQPHTKPLFLLADDSDIKRMFLRRFITRNMDVELLEATTTEEAIELINQHVEIGAGFIDYEIPTQDGPAIVKALLERNPKALVAVVGASDRPDYQRKSKEAGAQRYICTSHHMDEVERDLNGILAEWKAELDQEFSVPVV